MNKLQRILGDFVRLTIRRLPGQRVEWSFSLSLLIACLLTGCAGLSVPPGAPSLTATPPPDRANVDLPARPPRFESISVAQGLSESVVHAIIQDRQGFLWFGTDDGLNRYDGYSFQIYRNDPDNSRSLAHNSIRALLEDRDGRVWIGLANSGINRLDPLTGEFTRYRFAGDDPTSQGANRVETLLQDSGGVIWAGTAGGGLLRYDPDKG